MNQRTNAKNAKEPLSRSMQACRVVRPGPIDNRPLEFTELPLPQPMPGEVLVRVRCCGVCRTDLHIAEGDLPQRTPNVVPGHQIVGVVEALGEGASRFRIGDRIGIYGFGASAHITAQIAAHGGTIVHVATRSRRARDLALKLGAASVGKPLDRPPERLDAAILFAPTGELVPIALEALAPGGILSIAGIHLGSIPQLGYTKHLVDERGGVSVTANIRNDGEAFLDLADAFLQK